MPEHCPPRTSLTAFAAGTLPDVDAQALEDHLATCLDCACQLDTVTREQLASLGPIQTAAAANSPSPALAHLMETALGGFNTSSRQSAEAAVRAAFDPPKRPDAIGTFAGHDVLEIAGSGGMGVVLKAHDPTLHRDVALKVLSPNRAWNDADAARFLNEARTIASLQHDHVVAIYSAGREKGLPYLVMPFHAEGTLERQLQLTPKLSPDEVARIGQQLARALEATHAKGILHRDIKPSNVLLEGGLERVRLADFGLAEPALTDETGRTKTIAGTPHYMSPEQARGEAIDARSDLFGLGALLFQLATGRTVYDGVNATQVLDCAARGDVKSAQAIAPELPSALVKILDRLLAPDPNHRFRTASEVATAFDDFTHRASRRPRTVQRTVLFAIAACLVVAATILVLDAIGRTAVINTLLCQRNNDGYFIRGRFGTFARLPDAVAAAQSHDVIEARFSTEQLIDSFRIGGKPLTIRAVPGFTPILVATNNAQPMILADAPLALEGLTLWRRSPRINSAALVSVERVPLFLLNCRIARSRFQGQDILVWGKLRAVAMNEPQQQQFHRVLLAFQQGSDGTIQNCVVAGSQATAIGLRAFTNEPTRVSAENNLFVTDRTVFMRPDPITSAQLHFARSAIVTAGLLELDETEPVQGLALSFDDCVIDRTGGALLRVNQGHAGELASALIWRETNVLYAGEGSYVANRRRRQVDVETSWNQKLGLAPGSHRLVGRQIFPETTVRSALTLSANDLNTDALAQRKAGGFGFAAELVGAGKAYDAFRRTSLYDDWRSAVRARTADWEQQTALRRTNAPTAATER